MKDGEDKWLNIRKKKKIKVQILKKISKKAKTSPRSPHFLKRIWYQKNYLP